MESPIEKPDEFDLWPTDHYHPARLDIIAEETEQDIDDVSSCGSWQDISELCEENGKARSIKVTGNEDDLQPNSLDYHDFDEAIITGNFESVKAGIDLGADLEANTRDGNTPLILAIRNAQVEVARLLLESGADVHHRSHRLPPVVQAVLSPDREPELIQLLLDHGANLNATTSEQMNALHWAALAGKREAVEFLISKEMDLEKTCSKGRTPLILAAEKGWTSVAKVLLAQGADINIRSASGGTPLIWSACNNWIQTVKFWLEEGADVNAKDDNGLSALSLACHFGCLEVAETLLASGADVNSLSEKPKNFTAAMAAACSNCPTILKRLITAGADLYISNGSNETALDTALLEKSPDAVEVLLEAMGGEDYPKQSVALQFALANGHKMVDSLVATASLMYEFIEPGIETPGPYAWLDWVLNQGGDLVKPMAMRKLLHASLEEQSIGMIKALAQHGCDINARLESGHTPLSFAVGHRNLELIQALIDAGADPNVPHPDRENLNYTAFDDAIISLKDGDDTEVVDLLLKSGRCKINKGKDPSNTAFSYILSKAEEWQPGQADALAIRMIDSIPDVNEDRDDLGCTLVHVAVTHEREDFVDLLISRGADINAANENNYTPFILACQRCPKMVPKLIERGADPDAKYSRGASALHAAAAHGNVEGLQFLMDWGLDIEMKSENWHKPLECALAWGKEETALCLIKQGADLQWKSTQTQQTALHFAAKHHMKRAIEEILKHDVDVNARDGQGWTPLHEACAVGSPAIISFLLGAGADIESALPYGDRPLHVALINEHQATALYLIENGADITARASKNRMPLHLVAEFSLPRVARCLLEKGVSTEDIDEETWTPLCCADAACVTKLLIDHGAYVNYRDRDMWTPLHQAVMARDVQSVELLLKAGADVHIRTTDDFLNVMERAEELENESERCEIIDLLRRAEMWRREERREKEKKKGEEEEEEGHDSDVDQLGEKFEEL